MDRKGLLNPEQEKFLAKVLDDYFEFDNPIVEKLDRQVFLFMLKSIDNKGLDKIDTKWKKSLIPLIDAAMSLDIEATREQATQLLVDRVNIPSFDSVDKQEVFDLFTQFIVGVTVWYVKKHNEKDFKEGQN